MAEEATRTSRLGVYQNARHGLDRLCNSQEQAHQQDVEHRDHVELPTRLDSYNANRASRTTILARQGKKE